MALLSRLLSPALVFFWLLPASAQEAPDYEALMTALAGAENAAEADKLVPQIWQHWLTAPTPAAQEVLDAAMARRSVADYLGALKHLDVLVAEYPDYAEGWNQRATIYYMIGNLDASLADVTEVLAREPRHFGALSGQAMIYAQQGRIPLAQLTIQGALKHHPFLHERMILDLPGGDDI